MSAYEWPSNLVQGRCRQFETWMNINVMSFHLMFVVSVTFAGPPTATLGSKSWPNPSLALTSIEMPLLEKKCLCEVSWMKINSLKTTHSYDQGKPDPGAWTTGREIAPAWKQMGVPCVAVPFSATWIQGDWKLFEGSSMLHWLSSGCKW